jgi:hypothetical protein
MTEGVTGLVHRTGADVHCVSGCDTICGIKPAMTDPDRHPCPVLERITDLIGHRAPCPKSAKETHGQNSISNRAAGGSSLGPRPTLLRNPSSALAFKQPSGCFARNLPSLSDFVHRDNANLILA